MRANSDSSSNNGEVAQMMKPIGRALAFIALLVAAALANQAIASVTASVDRNRITLGDSVRLTLTASDDEDITERELQPLQKDFEILQRSTSSNTSIINGRVSQSRQVTIDLAPRREGNLNIPAMQFGRSTTPRLTVVVGAPSDTQSDGQTVVFEAEVDRDEVYVQGQIILTLRVQQAVNLEGRSVSPLQLDDAFVKPLEQKSFQRSIGGRPWLVDELRYAIFPEQSGKLTIPTQVFSGRIERGRRSFFDIGGGGQLVRRSTQPIEINVLPKPDSFPNQDWLTAQQLTLEETWSTPPDALRVGESSTRTIRLIGEGLQGAQLPPILFTPIDGLKYYPDQPTITEREIPSGLEGIREDSAALVPTREGSFVIPEIRIPWWDTTSDQLQYAVMPERTITATGALSGVSTNAGTAPAPSVETAGDEATTAVVDVGSATDMAALAAGQRELRIWQLLTAISVLGWVMTFLYFRRSRAPAASPTPKTNETALEHKAFKQLLATCASNDANKARTAIIRWSAAFTRQDAAGGLEHVARKLQDDELRGLLAQMDEALYRPGEALWEGEPLAQCVRRLRKSGAPNTGKKEEQPLRLYPTS
jgi:hypothetical protein